MKHTSKILALLFVALMILTSLTALSVSAEEGTTLYFKPCNDWLSDGARFSAYCWNDSGNTWIDMTNVEDGVYVVTIPAGYTNFLFARMNPGTTGNGWGSEYWEGQTVNLSIPTDDGINCFTVNSGFGTVDGTWGTYTPPACIHTPKDEGKTTPATCMEEGKTVHTCSKCGEPYDVEIPALGHDYGTDNKCTREGCNVLATWTVVGDKELCGSAWSTDDTKNDMTYDEETGVYTKVYNNVSVGDYQLKVVRDHAWVVEYPESGNGNKSVTLSGNENTVTVTWNPQTNEFAAVASHTHNYVKGDKVDPTCVDEGYTTYTCACGDVDKRDTKPATGKHSGGTATCEKLAVCDTCKQGYGKLAAHNHDGENGTCSGCGAFVFDGDIDLKDLTKGTAIKDGTTFVNGLITLKGDAKKSNSDTYHSIELTKQGKSYLTFTIPEGMTANVKLAVSSTGGTNESEFGIYDADGNAMENAENKYTITGSDETAFNYTLTAGTYTIKSVGKTISNRGVRVYEVKVSLKPVHVHVWADAWSVDTETGTHYYACSGCSERKDEAKHSGGTATCKEQAICTECGKEYGELGNHNYVDGKCTVCYEKDPSTIFYLVGYINGADCGCEDDYASLHDEYKFVDGKLTVTFTSDSYVFIKTADNANWYLFESYTTDKTGTLLKDKSQKMLVPGNVEVTFTLVVNENGTLTLSYTVPTTHDHDYADATCTTPKTCKTCGATEGEALGHNYANGVCTRCGDLEEKPDEKPGDETPGGNTGDETPGGSTGDETPGEENPGDETPGEENPGEEAPGETPDDEKPGEETPDVDVTPDEPTEEPTLTQKVVVIIKGLVARLVALFKSLVAKTIAVFKK